MEKRPDSEKQNEAQVEPAKPAEPAENVLGIADEPEPEEERRPKNVAAVFRDAFERARHGQKRGAAERVKSNPLVSDRSARNRDRTKTLFVSVVGLVAVLIIFLGVFSSSHTETKREQAAKRNPSLGRPEDQSRKAGSVTPLLSAEMNGQDAGNGQLTPEDINNTSRQRAAGEAARSAPEGARARAARPNSAHALTNVPFTDPALEAYRRQTTASTATPAPAVTATAPAQTAPPAISESEALGKASLVYVRTNANSGRSASNSSQLLPAVATGGPAFLDRQVWSGLPAGTRLVARLQTAVSTAVKAPVVAVIETHYERDGEIVLPAGSKAFGELDSGTRSG